MTHRRFDLLFVPGAMFRMLWVAALIVCCVTIPVPAAENAKKAAADTTHAAPDTTKAQEPVKDRCVACHMAEDMMPDGYLVDDIHMKAGLSCSGCHGGDPTTDDEDKAMSKAAGFRGVPDRKDIPAFCGRCHSDIVFMRRYRPRIATDQVSQYYTSVHGHKLEKGDKKVAECASCHTAHGVLPASDARSTVYALNVPKTCGHCHADADYMKPYGIPTNQYKEFVGSVHGKALLEDQDTGAPACNDCHGNHGATPPGLTSIVQVCGNCHVNNMQYFTKSRMGHAFVEEGYHGCEECHGNHGIQKATDSMVGTQDDAVCINCHSEGEKGFVMAGKIHAQLVGLTTVYDSALVAQKHVQKIGMDDVDIGYMLQDAHQDLVEARTLVHTFDVNRVKEKTDPGVKKADAALEAAASQVREYHVRRRGFGLATLFTTVLALALFLWIRQIEGK